MPIKQTPHNERQQPQAKSNFTPSRKANGHAGANGHDANGHSHLDWLHPHDIAARVSPELWEKRGRNGATARCPCHTDNKPSLDIDLKGDKVVVICRAHCPQDVVYAALLERGVLLFKPQDEAPAINTGGNLKALRDRGFKLTHYDYPDADGVVVCQKVRAEFFDKSGKRLAKTFRQRRPNPNGKGWIENLLGLEKLPLYRLAEMRAAPEQDVHLAEGEKDADTFARRGFVATSIDGLDRTDLEPFRGRNVVLHEDNDAAGREKVAKKMAALQGIAASMVVVSYPDAGHKGDVTDWFAQGHTEEELLARIEDARAEPAKPAPTAPSAMTEAAVANAFAEQETGKRIFEHRRGAWYAFDGSVWRMDETRATFRRTQDFCEALDDKQFQKLRTICAVEQIAKAHPDIAVTSEGFDADPYLLGTPSGHIDLRTGKMIAADPRQLVTMSTSCVPEKAPPTRWLKFLEECTDGDQGQIRLLQQIAGYALTGDIREHCLFFLYGAGRNGKGVFIRALHGILGTYSWRTGIETFSAGPDKHPTVFASMAGKRFVWTSETEQGRKWAAARIKDLSGGDPIAARFMRRDEFVFQPSFKLLISGNHEPTIENVDDAIRGRFHVIPFDRSFVGQEDRDLDTTLKAEWPRILQWAIDGCLDWQRSGLVIPEKVAAATRDYFEGQDLFAEWLNDRCDLNSRHTSLTRHLLPSWNAFRKEAGEPLETQRALTERLRKDKRFKQDKSPTRRNGENGRWWHGVSPR